MPTFQKSLLRNTHTHTHTHTQYRCKEQPRFYALFFLSNSHEDLVCRCGEKKSFFSNRSFWKKTITRMILLSAAAVVSDMSKSKNAIFDKKNQKRFKSKINFSIQNLTSKIPNNLFKLTGK